MGQAKGWLGRAERLLDRLSPDAVERGYMLLPLAFEQEAGGDWEAAATTLGEAAELGVERANTTCSPSPRRNGHILINSGR